MSTLKTTNVQHPSAADPAIELDAAGKLWLAGGKILQVVRATDATNRTTTSTSMVDASISVTITPQKNTSAILLIWHVLLVANGLSTTETQITDTSNNTISGAPRGRFTHAGNGYGGMLTNIAYATPATTVATTYKGRFLNNLGSTTTLDNANNIGQFYAIELSA